MVAAILMYNMEERKIAEEFVHRMVKRAVEMEGTVTVRTASVTWQLRSADGND